MKSAVETLSPTRVKLIVEVPFDELKPDLDKAYQTIGSQIQIPGFRKGKVPARIIDQRVGRGAVVQEAVNEALPRFFAEAVDNEVSKALAERVEADGGEVDIFTPDGFNAAQMIVRAIQEGGDDVAAMIDALEGWTFEGVKGELTIREEDHALLQPMFQARLEEQGGELVPVLVDTLAPEDTAPPVAGS